MYCTKCGHPFDGKFCPQCGHPVEPPGDPEQNPPVYRANPEGKPMIGQNYESTLRAFVGPNADYYLHEFRKIEHGEKTGITWRGLLGGLALLYRKMVKDYFLIFLIGLIPIAGIFLLIPRLFKMNKLYYTYVNRKLAENGLTGVDIEQAGTSAASKAQTLGGTSPGLAIGVSLGMVTMVAAICFIISSMFVSTLAFMIGFFQPDDRPVYGNGQTTQSSVSTLSGDPSGEKGNLGKYFISVDALELTQNDDQVYGIVTYTFTNNSSENCSFSNAFYVQAFQNGVEIPEDMFHFLLEDSGDNSIKDVRPGGSLQVQTAYKLADLTAPVLVEVSELYSFSDIKIEREFSLEDIAAQTPPETETKIRALDFMGKPMSAVVSTFGEGYTIENFLLSYGDPEIPYGFSGNLDTGGYVPNEVIDYILLGLGAYIDDHVYIGMYHDEIANYYPMQTEAPQKSETGDYNLFQCDIGGTPCTVCIDFDENERSTSAFLKLGETVLTDPASEDIGQYSLPYFYGSWVIDMGSSILDITEDTIGGRPYTVIDSKETYDSVEITFEIFEENYSYKQRAIIYKQDSPLRMMLYTENASGLFSGGTGFYKSDG
ncbi:MAG: DUF5067 domain-containing protein [Ruminococcaceae bacterium]|nr:DUF5067 domain-containing protein [Oscillospiraceae bacterium]